MDWFQYDNGLRHERVKNNNFLNRLELNTESNCFFILNGHKNNAANNPQVRFKNPVKNKRGRYVKWYWTKQTYQ